MRHLRQAMELLRLAFLVNADVFTELVDAGSLVSSLEHLPAHDELFFPSRDLRFVLCYQVTPINCTWIHRAIADHLLTARPLCAGADFFASYEALQADCIYQFQVERRAQPLRVVLVVDITSVEDKAAAEEVEDVVWNVGILAARVQAFKPLFRPSMYSPIRVTAIQMWIQDIPITRRVVFAFQEIMKTYEGLVHCEDCVVGPQRVTCSGDDLRDLLTAPMQSSPHAVVHLGRSSPTTPLVLDSHGEDLKETIRLVLEAVGSCCTACGINIAPLAMQVSSMQNRRYFWEAVLEYILCSPRSPSLDQLHFVASGGLEQQDIQHFRRAARIVKKPRRAIDQLVVESDLTGNALAAAFIGWIGNVPSLRFTRKSGSISSAMVRELKRVCPRVQHLKLDGLIVSNMNEFLEGNQRTPCCLILRNIDLIQSSSMDHFLGQLGNHASALARLNTLVIKQTIPNPRASFALDASQVRLLADVLKRNTTLRRLTIAVQRSVPQKDRLAVIRESRRNMIPPKMSADHRRRILAFLSVLTSEDFGTPWQKLDSWTVRRIVDFSALHYCRSVTLLDGSCLRFLDNGAPVVSTTESECLVDIVVEHTDHGIGAFWTMFLPDDCAIGVRRTLMGDLPFELMDGEATTAVGLVRLEAADSVRAHIHNDVILEMAIADVTDTLYIFVAASDAHAAIAYTSELYNVAWDLAVAARKPSLQLRIVSDADRTWDDLFHLPDVGVVYGDLPTASQETKWLARGTLLPVEYRSPAPRLEAMFGRGPNRGSTFFEDDATGIKYSVVVVNGTFDHLHNGHRKLLALATTVCSKTLMIGITAAPELLEKLPFPELIEPLEVRKRKVLEFVTSLNQSLTVDIVDVEDSLGPVANSNDNRVLIVGSTSDIDRINKQRSRRVGPSVGWHLTRLVRRTDRSTLSSSRLRERLAKTQPSAMP